MDKKDLLFKNLRDIGNNWTSASVEGIKGEDDLIWSAVRNDYEVMREIMKDDSLIAAYESILHEVIKGTIHSILVMLDGGDWLADHFSLDLVDESTNESLNREKCLHEEFFYYLNRDEK